MTPEAQRIAISEACGWVYCGSDSCTPWYLSPSDAPLFSADPKPWGEIDKRRRQIPDFLNNLNAMHEAEKFLDEKQKHEYICRLIDLLDENWGLATAPQRAEAFLHTLNLWKP